jgi:virulence-associated protein VapD
MILLILSLLINLYPIEKISQKDIEEKIKKLESIDINSDEYLLSLMDDLEGTSIIIKIKDKNKNNIAVFKTNTGSTNYRGEFASFKLANLVGFNIYSPTIISYLNSNSLKKIKDILESTKFEKFYGEKHKLHMKRKEENRKIFIQELNNYIEKDEKLYGALKSWLNNISFYVPLGSYKAFKKHEAYKYLSLKAPQPPRKKINLKQCTKLFEPYACTTGTLYLDDLAKDLSSMLVMDEVLSNRDRFPGGNIHFRSLTEDIIKKENKDIEYPVARILSLDNGAVLGNESDLKILKENVSRFNKNHILKLRDILNNKDLENQQKELYLNDEEFKIFRTNLKKTLEYIDSLEQKYKEKIWFK